jgi:hypothetical protein
VAVRRRFHGTSSECGVGINPGSRPCDSAKCSVCGILTTGFQTSLAGSGPGAGQMTLRYGAGIYSSSTSGKANDYAEGSEKLHGGKTMRTMFLVNAAAGRPFVTTVGTIQGMTEPPKDKNGHSYDSVVGEVGEALNYDELVVYNDRAVIPAYFIVYTVG